MVEKRKIHRVADVQGTLVQVLPETSAEQVTVADKAGKLVATNVEDALQELATNISNAGKVDDVKDVNGNSIVTNKVATLSKGAVGLGNVTNDAQVKRSEMGAASGVATLDTAGKVPSSQLPSYVDDVLEYANKASFPTTGESGKIYVAQDTNLTYRWSGTAYVEISPSLALGETSSTAYAGNKGKANADNIANIINGTTKVGSASKADSADTAVKVSCTFNIWGNYKWNDNKTGGSGEWLKYNGLAERNLYFPKKYFDADDIVGNGFDIEPATIVGVEGTHSAVKVDEKGRVIAGGKSIEFGTSGQTAPSDSLMVGGLFFELQ